MRNTIADPNKTYGLIVGIDAYEEKNLNREGLVNHAVSFAQWLRDKDVPSRNIFLCLSPLEVNKNSVYKLLNELELEYREATQKTISALLTKDLPSKEGDLLFTFWVGHGLVDSQAERRLLFADGTLRNSNNLKLDSLIKSLKSDYFRIEDHICIIDACASLPPARIRPLSLGGIDIPAGAPRPEFSSFILYSTREGEKSETSPEQKTSYFCEALLAQLKDSKNSTTLPPDMDVIAENLKVRFKDLYEQTQGQVTQLPIYVEMQTWDGDKRTLFRKDKSADLSRIQANADLTRKALNPMTLDRIPRECVKLYLQEISTSVDNNERKVIAIIGDAGYGKTTILGEIYDKMRNQANWVALVRCDNLSLEPNLSYESLAKALGNYISDNNASDSIIDIASDLTNKYGIGVLLIDTLDLVLNQAFIEPFHRVLRHLTDEKATVVFTCRDYEYDNILNPDKNLYALPSNVKRHPVPRFSESEIIQAAEAFFNKSQNLYSLNKGEKFGRRIVKLSSHDYQLREIICKPLLLRMLCELCESDGVVPQNLTASNLYKLYWNERIAKFRYNPNVSLPAEVSPEDVARKQEKLCWNVARTAFESSYDRLEVLVRRSDIEEIEKFDKSYYLAYEKLGSESVLVSEKKSVDLVRFFHQSFMEFAIALWLDKREAKESRERLLETLRNPDAWYDWWRIMREYLTIARRGEFERIINTNQLDMSNHRAFYAVAFAAASRDEPSALENLVDVALKQGSDYEQTLFEAAISMPSSHSEAAWKVILTLLEKGTYKTAANITHKSREMLIRLKPNLGECIDAALEAIEKRSTETHAES